MVTYSTFAIVALYLTITLLISYLVNKGFVLVATFQRGENNLDGLLREFRYLRLISAQ